jgi:hypothetical protein
MAKHLIRLNINSGRTSLLVTLRNVNITVNEATAANIHRAKQEFEHTDDHMIISYDDNSYDITFGVTFEDLYQAYITLDGDRLTNHDMFLDYVRALLKV